MTSVVDRFKKRIPTGYILDVPFPLNTKEIIFKVAKFAQSEQNEAVFKAMGILKEKGITRENVEPKLVITKLPDGTETQEYSKEAAYSDELDSMYYYCMAEFVKRHIKTWEHNTEGEKLPFNQANLEEFFNQLTVFEKMAIGFGYLMASTEDLKKKEADEK